GAIFATGGIWEWRSNQPAELVCCDSSWVLAAGNYVVWEWAPALVRRDVVSATNVDVNPSPVGYPNYYRRALADNGDVVFNAPSEKSTAQVFRWRNGVATPLIDDSVTRARAI